MLTDRKLIYFSILRVGLSFLIAFVVSQFKVDYIEALFYDARVRLKPVSKTSGHIELVSINSKTVEKLGRIPSAMDHIEFLSRLQSVNPFSIVYLVNPNEISGTPIERQQLAATMASIPNLYVGINDTPLKGQEHTFRLKPPFEKVLPWSATKPADSKIFARDDVARRLLISFQGIPSLHMHLAQKLNPQLKSDEDVRGVFEYLKANQTYIDFKPSRTYPTHGFASVLGPNKELEALKDKVVIIGSDTLMSGDEYSRTPFSRDYVAMTNMEVHANALDTLILNSAPVIPPRWFDLLLTCLISVLTVYAVLSLKPLQGLLVVIGALVGFAFFSYLAFWLGGVWIGMTHPILSIFISYYFFIPYRLIMENRRSWEYLQKNRLLTQVEELKTNFLSMMSHDLRTPIARIQGMTEIVRNDPNPLSLRQAEALQTLAKSSEELLDFVSSILNLTRVESKELRLHLQSRDPNSLLSEVIERSAYLAKSKEIEVISELEPLFSVKMDVDLMRQVFSNLLENAIKYSPEGSRILITSEELNGKVVVQIADQGMGIPEEELQQVFSKFFRSKRAKNSTIKGSGLGLYLAKYFVELHKGRLTVDSRVGEGSTFTVELPMDPGLNQSNIG